VGPSPSLLYHFRRQRRLGQIRSCKLDRTTTISNAARRGAVAAIRAGYRRAANPVMVDEANPLIPLVPSHSRQEL
jgi:hypothetical protein